LTYDLLYPDPRRLPTLKRMVVHTVAAFFELPQPDLVFNTLQCPPRQRRQPVIHPPGQNHWRRLIIKIMKILFAVGRKNGMIYAQLIQYGQSRQELFTIRGSQVRQVQNPGESEFACIHQIHNLALCTIRLYRHLYPAIVTTR